MLMHHTVSPRQETRQRRTPCTCGTARIEGLSCILAITTRRSASFSSIPTPSPTPRFPMVSNPRGTGKALTKDVLGWDKQGSVDQVLKIYGGFDPALIALIKQVDPAELKVWQLMDMGKLPTWIKGKLALMGDAAHPFTPRRLHQPGFEHCARY